MKLNHIHLTVDDMPATGQFLQRVFLLSAGYTDLTVADISPAALAHARA